MSWWQEASTWRAVGKDGPKHQILRCVHLNTTGQNTFIGSLQIKTYCKIHVQLEVDLKVAGRI
jgi:hypothetical protein